MSNILIIKGPELYKNKYISSLREKTEHSIKTLNFTTINNQVPTEDNNPDLVLVDLETNINLPQLIHYFKGKKVKIAVSASDTSEASIKDLFMLNIQGYLFHKMEISEVNDAFDYILKGLTYVHPNLSTILLKDYRKMMEINRPDDLLSQREWEILELITKAHTNKQMADELHISDSTVKNHVNSILKKFNVSDRTNAVLKAIKNNWVSL
ncbi:response regulator transcription factor [Oceanobacillus bengalensis]|uniref:DNA-binding response regulator n=1 Tax=Oceanobacillus bengalensis TaxID=1435466 RepID=A0A494YZE4_9BACI|nr:response regulator transcription factor [Oceanobacillus bengalensis]RKQ15597.1 DNA-binding response regulator [Oceanobacillus bengalensis]